MAKYFIKVEEHATKENIDQCGMHYIRYLGKGQEEVACTCVRSNGHHADVDYDHRKMHLNLGYTSPVIAENVVKRLREGYATVRRREDIVPWYRIYSVEKYKLDTKEITVKGTRSNVIMVIARDENGTLHHCRRVCNKYSSDPEYTRSGFVEFIRKKYGTVLCDFVKKDVEIEKY